MEERVEGFFEAKSRELESQVKSLQYDCAELEKSNSELLERVKKLGSRQPSWPRGYRPQRRNSRDR